MATVLVVWAAMAVATIALAIYRKVIANHEDTTIHLTHGGGAVVDSQAAMAAKLGAIDKWGKALTVATFVLGVAIFCVYVYEAIRVVPV
jgi:hypothetical protein